MRCITSLSVIDSSLGSIRTMMCFSSALKSPDPTRFFIRTMKFFSPYKYVSNARYARRWDRRVAMTLEPWLILTLIWLYTLPRRRVGRTESLEPRLRAWLLEVRIPWRRKRRQADPPPRLAAYAA